MPQARFLFTRSSRRRGFSLVLSLTIMAMLLLLCVSGAALLTMELRVGRASIAHAKARLNALCSVRIALGTLQTYAGQDRRITAPASLLDTNKATWASAESVKQPHLSGVWRAKTVSSNYDKTHDDAFICWLTSGSFASAAVHNSKAPLTVAPTGLMLLGAGSSSPKGHVALEDTDDEKVYAPTEAIPGSDGSSTGRIAWWIADENVKANLSLRLPPESPNPTPADALAMARNAIRMGLKAPGDGVFDKFPEALPFKVPGVWRSSLAFDTDTPGNFWLSNTRNYFHEITPYSESLLTDVVNGGLKYDLSLMLALDKLPDGYRDAGKIYGYSYDIETYRADYADPLSPSLPLKNLQLAPAPVGLESTVPGAGSYAKAKGLWLKAIPEAERPVVSNLGEVKGKEIPPFNKLDWTGWPDVWSFARIYRLAEPSFKDTNRFTPSTQFNPQTGMFMASGVDLMSGIRYFNQSPYVKTQAFLDRNPDGVSGKNGVDVGNMSPWRMPVVTALQISLSLRGQVNPATNKTEKLFLIVRPYVQLWNPYNVPLRFGDNQWDSLQLVIRCLPGKLKITTNNNGLPPAILESNDWRFNPGDWGRKALCTMAIYAPNEFPRPLAPGEVRVYSPAAGLAPRGDATFTVVTPGLRPTGGYEIPLTSVAPFDGAATVQLLPNDGPGYPSTTGSPPMHISIDWNEGGNDGQGARQSTGHGVAVEWNGAADAVLKIDSRTTDVNQGQLKQQQGQAFARFSMRLRSETTSIQRSPFLAYGDVFRQVWHPKPAGSFQNNPEMKLSPFEFCHSKVNSDEETAPANPSLDCNPANNHGYAFTGYTPGDDGLEGMVLSHLPLAPVASLGDFRDARLGGGVSYHRLLQTWWDGKGNDPNNNNYTPQSIATLRTGGRSVVQDPFGNSFGHPMIPVDKITAASAHVSESYYDFSWIMNSSLWDAYCATGFSPENSSFSAFAGRTLDNVADDFLLKGGALSNRRILFRDYGPGGAVIKSELITGTGQAAMPIGDDDKSKVPAFAKAPAAMIVNGGFNINSTSVRAWRAMLAGLNNSVVPQFNPTSPLPAPIVSPKIDSSGVALRNPIQNGPLAEVNTGSYDAAFNTRRALAGRKLSEAQLTELAQKIVEQVKLRGPFLSLGEFMNRRLEKGTPLGDKGAIQAAIDATNINAFAKGGSVLQVTSGDAAGFTNPAAVVGSQARGMPGVVCQADIVSPLATELTARSDTFVIRAAGTSEDGAVAFVEMVVRRNVNYLDSRDDPAALPNDAAKPLKICNKAFGRRFTPVAIRWVDRAAL